MFLLSNLMMDFFLHINLLIVMQLTKREELLIKNDFSTGHIDGEKQKFKDDIKINIVPKSVKIFGK